MTARTAITACAMLCAGTVLTGCLQAPPSGHQRRGRPRRGSQPAPARPAGIPAAGHGSPPRPPDAAASLVNDARPLDAAHLLHLAMARDQDLAVARAEAGLALARLALAGQADDPQLRMGLTRNQTPLVVDEQMTSEGYSRYAVGLRVFPAHPWARRAERQREAALALAAAEAVKESEARVRETVRQAITRLRHAQEELAWQSRREALAKARQGWVAEMAAEGRATADQSALADMAAFQSRRAHTAAVVERDRRLRRLAALTGLSRERLLSLLQTGGLDPDPGMEPDVDAPASDIRATRNAVQRARVEAAEAGLRLQRARRIPWFSHLQATLEDDPREGRRDAWSLQGGVTLPLRARCERQHDRAEAEYLLALSEWTAAETRDEARIVAAREALADALHSARAAEQEGRPLLETLRDTRDALEAGDVADRAAQLQMEEAMLHAEHAAMQARFAVERARDDWIAALGAEL